MKLHLKFARQYSGRCTAAFVIAGLFAGVSLAAPLAAQEDMPGARPGAPPASAPNEAATNCVSLSTIRRTEILSDQEILLTLQNESRLKLSLAGSCPQLEYQGRFSYGATAGQLCSGRDRIITRSGDACLIEGFEVIEQPQ